MSIKANFLVPVAASASLGISQAQSEAPAPSPKPSQPEIQQLDEDDPNYGYAEPQLPNAKVADRNKPKVENLGDGKFKIGKINFDANSKTLTFPATLNMNEGLLEYVLVMNHGKTHEALLVTEADPFDLQIALKLLDLKPVEKYFPELDEKFRPIPQDPPPQEAIDAACFQIRVDWTHDSDTQSALLSELILDMRVEKPMPKGRWIYTGSVIHQGEFFATKTGDVIAIFRDQASLFNFHGDGADDDTIWFPATKKLPPPGTAVSLTFLPPITK